MVNRRCVIGVEQGLVMREERRGLLEKSKWLIWVRRSGRVVGCPTTRFCETSCWKQEEISGAVGQHHSRISVQKSILNFGRGRWILLFIISWRLTRFFEQRAKNQHF